MSIISQIYSGFISGKNEAGKEKEPAGKFTDPANIKSFDEISESPNILGILKPDIIMVDFDDTKDANAFCEILKTLSIKVPAMITTKGMHFYFKHTPEICDKALTAVQIACGLKCDFKLGSKNGLDCVKYQNVIRKTFYEDIDLINLPNFCKPVETRQKYAESFTELNAGSRNNTLFTFLPKLKAAGFNQEQSHQLLLLINNCVLPNPMSQDEIATIARKETFEKAYENNGAASALSNDPKKPIHPEIADRLILKYDIIKCGPDLYYRDKQTHRIFDDDAALGRLIIQMVPDTTIKFRKEVKSYIESTCEYIEPEYDNKYPNLLSFNNGVVDLLTGDLYPYDKKCPYMFTMVPFDYNPNQTANEVVDKFMRDITCGNPEIETLLYEMIGACLYRKTEMRSIFILKGDKANGKSTFLNFLTYALGHHNVSHLKLADFSERFAAIEIKNKLANLGDDISDSYIKDPDIIKSIASSDNLTSDVKYRGRVSFIPYATSIFSANSLPRINDLTGAVKSRLIIVPFNAYFPKPDVGLIGRLHQPVNAQYLLHKGMLAYRSARLNGTFTLSEFTKQELDNYDGYNNPIVSFLKEEIENPNDLIDRSTNDVYEEYLRFCQLEKFTPVAQCKFTMTVLSHLIGVHKVRRRAPSGLRKFYYEKCGEAVAFK